MVNCTPDFEQQPQVINGCSDLFIEVFGDAGRHTRSAVGFVALPGQIPVEIECTMEVRRRPLRWSIHDGAQRAFSFGDLS